MSKLRRDSDPLEVRDVMNIDTPFENNFKQELIGNGFGGFNALIIPGANVRMLNIDATNSQLFISHIYRILLSFLFIIIYWCLCGVKLFKEVYEFQNQFFFTVFKNEEYEESSWFKRSQILTATVPDVLNRLSLQYFLKSTPLSAHDLNQSFPPKCYLPNHIGLFLAIERNVVPHPSELPQPYLSADKKIVCPDKNEISKILAMRTEYFTQQKSHMAAEKIRLITEISRFVLWSQNTNTIRRINIYDESTTLLCGLDLSMIRDSLIAELYSMNSGNKTSIPNIKLINLYNNEELVINEFCDVSFGMSVNLSGIEETIDPAEASLIPFPSYDSTNAINATEDELIVYLIPNNAREKLVELTHDIIENGSIDTKIDKVFSQAIPKPQLVFKSSVLKRAESLNYPILTSFSVNSSHDVIDDLNSPYAKSDSHDDDPVLYFTNERFSFNFFIRGLFYYSSHLSSTQN